MRQQPDLHHEDPGRDEDEEDLEKLAMPLYQGTGLSVRALTAEELQRFLDAHHDQPAELLGRGWAALDQPEHPSGFPEPHRRLAVSPPARRRRCRPGRPAAAWAAPAAPPWPPIGAAAARSWPAGPAHLVIGPSGVFVIDSKQWTDSVHRSADGLAWPNHHPLERTLETVRWEAEAVGRLLGTHTTPLVCVHGAYVQGGGLDAEGVAIVPAHLLRSALGYDRVLSDADVALVATTAWTRLHPAA
jgi:hypothetical protein